jgi:hypothetical protein
MVRVPLRITPPRLDSKSRFNRFPRLRRTFETAAQCCWSIGAAQGMLHRRPANSHLREWPSHAASIWEPRTPCAIPAPGITSLQNSGMMVLCTRGRPARRRAHSGSARPLLQGRCAPLRERFARRRVHSGSALAPNLLQCRSKAMLVSPGLASPSTLPCARASKGGPVQIDSIAARKTLTVELKWRRESSELFFS